MNLWFRLFKVILIAIWAQRLKATEESVLHFRVWPNDLDINLHMNNGRYLTIMDLGRLDLLMRSGVLWPAFKRGWLPFLGGAVIRFRRPLDAFQAYRLRTRTLGWDNKWFYNEHIFEGLDGTLIAKAIVRGLLRGKEGSIPPQEVVDAILGRDISSPPLPPEVTSLEYGS